MVWCKKSFGWWTLSGLLLGISFLVPVLWILSLVGGGLFIWRGLEDRSKLAFLGGWWAWTIKYMCASSHVPTTYPIEWLEIKVSAVTQIILIGLYWSTMGIWLGFGGVVVVGVLWVYRKYFRGVSIMWLPLVLVPIWILGEVLGSLSFSIFTYGPGGSVNVSFGLGYSGYLLGEHGVLRLGARLAGVYGLSAVFVFLSFLVFRYKDDRKKMYTLLFFLFVSGYFYYPAPPPLGEKNYTVAVVNTYFDRHLYLTDEGQAAVRQKLVTAVDAALQENTDYLILPEGANYLQHEKIIKHEVLRFKQNYPDTKTILIDSGAAVYNNKAVVEAVVANPTSGKSTAIHKRYLVPQGEFMPVVYTSVLRLIGSESMVGYVKSKTKLTIGPKTNQSVLEDQAPGILLCFESMSPIGVRTILREKPTLPFIAHPISHQWFHEPVRWWHGVDLMLQMQALWNNVYIVSAGNHVAGKTYAPNGTIVPMEIVVAEDDWEVTLVQIPR